MLKRFVAFLVGGLLLCGLGVLFYWNPGTVEFRVSQTRVFTLPLPLLLLLSFLGGGALVFLLALVREAQWSVAERLRQRRERRQARRRETLEAGRSELRAGRAERARGLLRRNAAVDDIDATLTLAEADLDARRLDEAIALLEQARRKHPGDTRIFDLLGRALARAGNHAAATAAFEQGAALDPDDLHLVTTLRDSLIVEGRWAEAVRAEETLVSLLRHPDDIAREQPRVRGLRLEAALASGDDDTVVAALRALVAWDPGFLPFSIALGDRLVRLQQPVEATRVWARAAARRPEPVVAERLERLYRDLDRPKRMTVLYRRWLRRHPEPLLRLAFVRFLVSTGRADEAETELGPLQAPARQSPTFHALVGEIHRLRGNTDLALASFRSAVADVLDLKLAHQCSSCGRAEPEWRARCAGCGSWDSLRPAAP